METDESLIRAPGYVISLNEDRRASFRERLRANLPSGADGSIHLIARRLGPSADLPVIHRHEEIS